MIVTITEVFDDQCIAEQFLILFKTDIGVNTARRLDFIQLNFIDLAGARGSLFSLRCVSRETGHEGLQLSNLCLFLGIFCQQTLTGLGCSRHILIIVARIKPQLTVVQIRHVSTHRVQEVTVVRNDDHGAVTLTQRFLQPADSIDIQVVGRFVEQQNIWISKQCLRQQHTQFPAGRYSTHQAEMLFQRNANP